MSAEMYFFITTCIFLGFTILGIVEEKKFHLAEAKREADCKATGLDFFPQLQEHQQFPDW